jgi:hypothetical protein
VCLLGFLASQTFAKNYYVSALGNDGNSGLTAGSPWKTITQVNQFASDYGFQPGDTLYFHGGDTFSGSIYFTNTSGGTASKPFVITSYANGRAIISGGTAVAFYAYNTAGMHVSNLTFVGSGKSSNTSYGILFYLDLPDTSLSYVSIDSVESSGFLKSGICLGSYNNSSGYNDVTISNSSAHDNGEAGISSFSQNPYCHKRWTVRDNETYLNTGRPEVTTGNTGSGIELAGLDSAVIERNVAYKNGALNAHVGGGPMGIWTYASKNVIIQFNESHDNFAGSDADGGGFDLDGGTQNCIMQYNYSHDNEGSGYEIAQYVGAAPMLNNTIRYNISQNDARKNLCGGILLWGGDPFTGCDIYNNTIYSSNRNLRPSASPSCIFLFGSNFTGVHVWNNIFYSVGVPLINSTGTADTSIANFQQNDYFDSTSNVRILWGDSTFTSLDSWRNATSEEKLNAAKSGFVTDPMLQLAGAGLTIDTPAVMSERLGMYRLQPHSTLVWAGLDLQAQFGVPMGGRDFFGDSLSVVSGISVGADQFNLPPGGLRFAKVVLKFDTVFVDSVTRNFDWLSNPFSPKVNIDSTRIVGADAAEFLLVPMLPFVAAQDSQRVQVVFAPTSAGLKTATLQVYFGGSVDSVRSVLLIGFAKMSDTVSNTVTSATEAMPRFSVSPNPTYGGRFSIRGLQNARYSVTVSDMLGREWILAGKQQNAEAGDVFDMKALGILPGSYVLRLRSGDESEVVKVVYLP